MTKKLACLVAFMMLIVVSASSARAADVPEPTSVGIYTDWSNNRSTWKNFYDITYIGTCGSAYCKEYEVTLCPWEGPGAEAFSVSFDDNSTTFSAAMMWEDGGLFGNNIYNARIDWGPGSRIISTFNNDMDWDDGALISYTQSYYSGQNYISFLYVNIDYTCVG